MIMLVHLAQSLYYETEKENKLCFHHQVSLVHLQEDSNANFGSNYKSLEKLFGKCHH